MPYVTRQDETLFPALGLRSSFTPRPREDGSLDCRGAMEVATLLHLITLLLLQDLTAELAIPVEEAQAEVLMVAGQQDHNWDSVGYARMALERCRKAGRHHLEVEVSLYHMFDCSQ